MDLDTHQNNSIYTPVIQFLFSSLVMWQLIFHISDAAVKVMIVIIKRFLSLLSNTINCDELKYACDCVPKSYDGLLKFVGLDSNKVTSYVVCPSCNSIYDYDQCYEVRRGNKVPLKCKYVAFPDHPHRNQRRPCGTSLLKEVKLQNGKKLNPVPIKTYPYQSLRTAIATLVSNPDFLNVCDHWRKRSEKIPDDILADVYDGATWKNFNSENFLKHPGNLLLSLNVDWFQPYQRTRYSVGVLYLVILNLPRDQRYKIENVIISGIIPGPKEPKLTMNSFIAPLVQELDDAFKGWVIPTNHSVLKTVCIRLCIGCIVSDVPATRKICGFLGHTARLGCNKCLKEFPVSSFAEKPNFSGYNRSDWEVRTKTDHKMKCQQLLKATTKTELESLETQYGIRYSILVDLPLFDPITFVVVDPMHNLLLGTAKHVISTWTKRNILTQQNLESIQNKTELLSFPYDIGRIPTKIGSSFSGFTADQWRTWTTVISPIVLKGILPSEHLRCWLLFVNACRLMITRIISLDSVSKADDYLVLFCKTFQTLYGDMACTPNMHLHMHLKECFLNFGPAHGFWSFPFERYNGILGTFHTNNKNIEVQLLNKFIRYQMMKRMSAKEEWFSNAGNDHDVLKLNTRGSVQETEQLNVLSLMKLATDINIGSVSYKIFKNCAYIKTVPPMHERVLSSLAANQLQMVYQQLYPNQTISFFSLIYNHYKRVIFADDFIGQGEVVMAYWPGNGSSLDNINYSACRVGIIKYFLKHTIKVAGEKDSSEHLFCYINWKQVHPFQDWYGKSALVSSTLNEVENACCYMPVQRIAFRCASGELVVDFGDICETVFVASPIAIKFCI